MNDLQSSGSLPRGMIIGFKVYDPRLKYVYHMLSHCDIHHDLQIPSQECKTKSG